MAEDTCAVCGGSFLVETERAEVSADIPMGSDECSFVPQPNDSTRCETDGWLKIEHEEFSENQIIHMSCYFDHDDVLSLA